MATIPIEVIVQDAEAPIVPSEDGTNTNITVPDTGTISSNIDTSSSASSIILPAILLILAIGSIVAILIHKYHKQKKDKTTRKEKLAVATSSTIAILVATVLIGNLVIPATKAATSDVADGITPAEDKVSIVVTRDGGVAETSIESTATITSTSDFGYKVLLSMVEGVETSNLYLDGDEESEYYIASVEAENEEGVELADNTWGYALTEDGEYSAIPLLADAVVVAQGDEPVEDELLSVYYGVKVSSDLPAGTYTGGEIEYSLVSLEPTISTLTYMQDFAKLSESGKASVLRSMTEDEQYTLKDSRDKKDYFIAKLADGNVWMTQNLDHNIGDIEGGTYTSADTDLPSDATWTPSSSEYTKQPSDTSWANSFTAPESYDRGNLYWNGNLVYNQATCDANGGSWVSNMYYTYCYGDDVATSTSGNNHYLMGNYYNWTAAVAMSNSSSYTSGGTDVNQSVCPAGWRLPTYSGDKSYQNLVSTQGLTAGTSGNIQSAPTYFVYGGYREINPISGYVGYYGRYWSSVVNYDKFTYPFNFDANGNLNWNYIGRGIGCSLRCVAR